MSIAVVAIGGNSLAGTIVEQRTNLLDTCEGIAAAMNAGFQVVVTHGNGPQVGDALLRSELAAGQVEALPLDACVAETQGSIGYILQQVLQETLQRHGLRRPVVTMITQVLVSPRDDAFHFPTKPVGPFYTLEEAVERRLKLGWHMVEDAHRGFRRVVASPQAEEVIELPAIKAALLSGALVIACGGGGIPVIFNRDQLTGVEAVIDKDRVSSLLAWELEAAALPYFNRRGPSSTELRDARRAPTGASDRRRSLPLLARGPVPSRQHGPQDRGCLELS